MKNFSKFSAVMITCILLAGLNVYSQVGSQVPLNPKAVPQFVDPLPHFAGLRVDASGGNLTIKYEPTQQVAVSTGTVLAGGTVGETPGIGLANLWAYSVSNGTVTTPPYWPAFTIVAQRGTPVKVKYVNNLGGQTYADVGLVADQTLHWADPLGEKGSFDPYSGPVPVVPHLHGAVVPSESDGGPDAWFTPGYKITGPAWRIDGTDQNYMYPNTQEAATLWWHDHALGATRLNVYAGLAGFYFLRGPDEENDKLPGWSGDDLVKEVAPAGTSGTFNPDPYLPEIEVVFQDRMFDTDGKLYFPNLPTNPTVHPFWAPEFIGDIITVNGKTWPYLSVAPRKYRFRLLNGSNARFYSLKLQGATGGNGPSIVQIGTDGGLLDSPVPISGELLMAPGERADVVIDFNGTEGSEWIMVNSARAPYPKGSPPNGTTTGRIMKFVVNGKMISASGGTSPGSDKSSLPGPLRTPMVKLSNFNTGINSPSLISVKRQLTLNEVMGMGGPLEVLVNNTKWDGNGMNTPGLGETELPVEGTTELWQIINLTADAHPIHLHLTQFQIVSRQPFNVNNYSTAYNNAFGGTFQPALGPPLPYNNKNTDGAVGGNPAVSSYLQGSARPPEPNERGWKDTHVVMPGEVTTFIVRFAPTDLPLSTDPKNLLYDFDPSKGPGYVWHCHIIDHEDNEMMRPYKVIASPYRNAGKGPKTKAITGSSGTFVPDQVTERIDRVTLEQNSPNPFSVETEIRFKLPEAAHVRMTLYSSTGAEVQTILDADAPSGLNTVRLNAGNLKAGVYFYQLRTGLVNQVKRMIIQK